MSTTVTSTRRGDAAVVRRIWRLHFWVGLFAAPVLVVLALSGLTILYSQPLDTLLNRDLLVVSQGPETVPLDDQVAVAQQHVGADYSLDAVTPPAKPGTSTRIDFLPPDAPEYPAGESNVTQVFVDPYTGEYLGQRSELSGLIGLANQLHRMFGNDGPHVQLPSLGHLIAPSAYPDATIPVGLGNLWMELTATWIVVLLASGIFLWWPRAIEAAKPLLKVRWSKGGRIRWRDVHALTGVLIAVILICYILSGLTWSRYWGENWRAFSATVAPSATVDAPSTPATMGQYDRLGRRIAWAAKDDPVYASLPGGSGPAPMTFDDIDRIAKDEHMVPGYAIIPPSDSEEDGAPVFGSYTVVNAWPQKLSEQRTLYLNQFTGETITNATAAQDGALSRLTSFRHRDAHGQPVGRADTYLGHGRRSWRAHHGGDRLPDVVEATSQRRRWSAQSGERGDPCSNPSQGSRCGGGLRSGARCAVPGLRDISARGSCGRGRIGISTPTRRYRSRASTRRCRDRR